MWDIFTNPYLACAAEPGQIGLLQDDLGRHLWPDVDEPIAESDEDRLLSGLAGLHARYWESEALGLPWLVQPSELFAVMGPHTGEVADRLRPPPSSSAPRWSALASGIAAPLARRLA